MSAFDPKAPWQHANGPNAVQDRNLHRLEDHVRQYLAHHHGGGAAKPHAPEHAPATHNPGHQDGWHAQDVSPGPHESGSDWSHGLDHPGGGPFAVMPVDHLTLDNNSVIENHITDTSSIVLNAAPGGDIDVGGSVNALSAQHAEVQSVSASHGFGSELGWGPSAWGEAGGFDAVLIGHLAGLGGAPIVIMPVDHLTINNNTFVQNTEVETTNVTFNAGTGSTIDVGGSVSALSDQAGHFGYDPHGLDAHPLDPHALMG